MKFSFLITGLSEHKIRPNSSLNDNISLPGYAFCFDETKLAEQAFLLTKNTQILWSILDAVLKQGVLRLF